MMGGILAGNERPRACSPPSPALSRRRRRRAAHTVRWTVPLGEGGLGLPLAERLAADVGWYPSGTVKHVWATFTVVSPN